jgi:fructokinase
VTLDPNVRPRLIPDRTAYLRRLQGWVELVDVLKVSTATATARVSAPRVRVVDTVGAGDAFMPGGLAHLYDQRSLSREEVVALDKDQLAELLRTAAAVAAYTCTGRGPAAPRGAAYLGCMSGRYEWAV